MYGMTMVMDVMRCVVLCCAVLCCVVMACDDGDGDGDGVIMTWCGVLWCVVLCCVVCCCAVWCGVVWCGVMWCGGKGRGSCDMVMWCFIDVQNDVTLESLLQFLL